MQSAFLSPVVNKGLPERRTLSTSAPVILLTMRTGAVSPVSSGASKSSHFFSPTVVYGRAWRAEMSPIVAGAELGHIKLDARLRHKAGRKRRLRSEGDKSCLGPWRPR